MSVLRAPISPVSVPESSLKGVGAEAPENGVALAWSCSHFPAKGGSGRKGATVAGLHPRGREATVILAAPVWELETLARQSRGRGGSRSAGGPGREQLFSLSLTSNLDSKCLLEGHLPPTLLSSQLHLCRGTGQVVALSNLCRLSPKRALTCGGSSSVQSQLNGVLLQSGCGR